MNYVEQAVKLVHRAEARADEQRFQEAQVIAVLAVAVAIVAVVDELRNLAATVRNR